MFEVILLVLAVVIFFIWYLFYYSNTSQREAFLYESRIAQIRSKLKIAEKKFMQNKISKQVFDSLIEDLQEELAEAELVIYRLKKEADLSVDDKTNQILERMPNPTRHQRATIARILKETELLRNEMSLLEAKLLKREIRSSVFERILRKKEGKMIQNESEILGIVNKKSFTPVESPAPMQIEKEVVEENKEIPAKTISVNQEITEVSTEKKSFSKKRIIKKKK